MPATSAYGRRYPCLFRVRLLQTFRDQLHPPQLRESTTAHDHPAREREPWFESAAQQSQPCRARRIDLWARSFQIRGLRVQLALAGLELDRAPDVREAQQSATGLHVLERIAHRLSAARGSEYPEHELGHVVPRPIGLRPSLSFAERSREFFPRHRFERSHLSRSFRATIPRITIRRSASTTA